MDTYRLWALSKVPPSQFPYTSDATLTNSLGVPVLFGTRYDARCACEARNRWVAERCYVVGVYVDIYRTESK